MKSKVINVLIGIICGIMLLFACIFVGLIIIFAFRGIYEINIDNWNLCRISGLGKPEIMENYNAMMNWCFSFADAPFSLPTLPFSEQGAIHFEECKVLFRGFLSIGIISILVLPFVLRWATKNKKPSIYYVSSATAVIIPVAVLGATAINFDRAFVTFHKLFFNNDYWIFDSRKDPIINLLPEDYFLLCGVIIAIAVLIGVALLIFFGIRLQKSNNKLSKN